MGTFILWSLAFLGGLALLGLASSLIYEEENYEDEE